MKKGGWRMQMRMAFIYIDDKLFNSCYLSRAYEANLSRALVISILAQRSLILMIISFAKHI